MEACWTDRNGRNESAKPPFVTMTTTSSWDKHPVNAGHRASRPSHVVFTANDLMIARHEWGLCVTCRNSVGSHRHLDFTKPTKFLNSVRADSAGQVPPPIVYGTPSPAWAGGGKVAVPEPRFTARRSYIHSAPLEAVSGSPRLFFRVPEWIPDTLRSLRSLRGRG